MPVTALYSSTTYQELFKDGLDELGLGETDMGCNFRDFRTLVEWPREWQTHCVLASGSLAFCKEVCGKLKNHLGYYRYVVDMDFSGLRHRQLESVLGSVRSGG